MLAGYLRPATQERRTLWSMNDTQRTPHGPVDEKAARAMFAAYLAAHPHLPEPALAAIVQFGDSAEMADELAALVVAGVKTATASLVSDYDEAADTLPFAGTHWVMCAGDGTPLAVLRTTDVRTGPIDSVDDGFAWDEGEGDRTRDGWLAGHGVFWTRVSGGTWTPDTEVVFERFEVAWTP